MELSEQTAAAAETARRYTKELEEIASGYFVRADDGESYDRDTDQGILEYLDSNALELVTLGIRDSYTGEWRVVGWRIVWGTGGPHVQTTLGVQGDAEHFARWGSGRSSLYSFAPTLASYLDDLEESR